MIARFLVLIAVLVAITHPWVVAVAFGAVAAVVAHLAVVLVLAELAAVAAAAVAVARAAGASVGLDRGKGK